MKEVVEIQVPAGSIDDLEAIAKAFEIARDQDPLTRLLEQLPDDEPLRVRRWAEETIELRGKFLQHVQGMLQGNPREAIQHAEWVRENAREVAFRWTTLMRQVVRHAERDFPAFKIRFTPASRP